MSQYTIVLDLPDKTSDGIRTEPAMRLKQLLKLAGRAFGARCVSVSETPVTTNTKAEATHAVRT